MRRLRASLALKKASADPGCTVQYTSALVVPPRSSSSRKNWATSAAYSGFSKRRSVGNVYFSSHGSSPGAGDAIMSVCG